MTKNTVLTQTVLSMDVRFDQKIKPSGLNNKVLHGWILTLIVMAIGAIGIGQLFTPVYAQEVVTVNNTQPCFLNYTAGAEMWDNCGVKDDFLRAFISPFEWVTGGHFSMLLVGIFILFTYIKYHKAVYPLLIGVMFLPFSFFLFPETFITFALLMAGIAIAALIWYVFVKQTKEY